MGAKRMFEVKVTMDEIFLMMQALKCYGEERSRLAREFSSSEVSSMFQSDADNVSVLYKKIREVVGV